MINTIDNALSQKKIVVYKISSLNYMLLNTIATKATGFQRISDIRSRIEKDSAINAYRELKTFLFHY